jgi:hypothetical protein
VSREAGLREAIEAHERYLSLAYADQSAAQERYDETAGLQAERKINWHHEMIDVLECLFANPDFFGGPR